MLLCVDIPAQLHDLLSENVLSYSVLLTRMYLLSGSSKGQLRKGEQELRVTPAGAASSPAGAVPQHLNTASRARFW